MNALTAGQLLPSPQPRQPALPLTPTAGGGCTQPTPLSALPVLRSHAVVLHLIPTSTTLACGGGVGVVLPMLQAMLDETLSLHMGLEGGARASFALAQLAEGEAAAASQSGLINLLGRAVAVQIAPADRGGELGARLSGAARARMVGESGSPSPSPPSLSAEMCRADAHLRQLRASGAAVLRLLRHLMNEEIHSVGTELSALPLKGVVGVIAAILAQERCHSFLRDGKQSRSGGGLGIGARVWAWAGAANGARAR
ncbi:MAG: hypothetical protein SGPRY_000694 [Prymnesium sp.]